MEANNDSKLDSKLSPDWDTATQRELFDLKRQLKKKEREVKGLKRALCEERDRVYRRERELDHLIERLREMEKKEKINKQKEEKREREEQIVREAKLRVRAEEEERAKVRAEEERARLRNI